MNYVEISGEISGVPEPEGHFSCAVLKFGRNQTVRIVATGKAGAELLWFHPAEGVKVVGSLIRSRTGVLGILADRVKRTRTKIPKFGRRCLRGPKGA